MQRFLLRRFAWLCLGAWSLAGSAAAQAPIVYAAQSDPQAALAGDSLAGGGEGSYGYGETRPGRGEPIIDIRRGVVGRLTPVADTSAADAAEQGRPAWLEQERIGPPYEAGGRWYVPSVEPGYEQTGTASWYGADFHGQRTASGEPFDQDALTAAHPTLPIPSLVQITNLENGREVIVRVNDRGPFVGSRLIDVSHRTAEVLGFAQAGHARVHVRYLGPAPRHVAMDGTPAPAAVRVPAVVSQQAGEAGSLLGSPQADRDSGATPTQTRGAFFVQVGAYANLDNAHRARDAVGAAGPVTVDI